MEDPIEKWRRMTRQKSLDYKQGDASPKVHQAYLDALGFVSDMDYDMHSMKIISGKERIFLYGLRCHILYGPFVETKSWNFSSIDRAKRDAWRQASALKKTREEAMELFIETVEDFIKRLPHTPQSMKILKSLQSRHKEPIILNFYESDHFCATLLFICCTRNLQFVLNRLPESLERKDIAWIDDNSELFHGRFISLKYLCNLNEPPFNPDITLFPSELELQLKIEIYIDWHLSMCYPEIIANNSKIVQDVEKNWLGNQKYICGTTIPTIADILFFFKLSNLLSSGSIDTVSQKLQKFMSDVASHFEKEFEYMKDILQNTKKEIHSPVLYKAAL